MVSLDQIEINGNKGSIPNSFIHRRKSKKIALMFPGMGYTYQGPLLYYTTLLLVDCGYDVLQINYQYGDNFKRLPEKRQEELFYSDIDAAYDAVTKMHYNETTIVGKSIGTEAMVHLLKSREIDRNAWLVWLTPVMNNMHVLEALRENPAFREKSIIIAGTKDRYFDLSVLGKIRRERLAKIITVQGADHSLDAENDYETSIKNIMRTMSHIETFISR